ncbi:hypothetical protein BJEO58_01647 [Brevibacterium jeotgali]|uniref:Uncharacterized protein n=1 Tax=Brevibacterium jeotgali TaxID=1262550 RepID=A0A2H1L6Q3_9MICO|nr:hypothetical protein FB108_2384 [Brevibacterium jeotgali]SMY12053.1 hypothetical protein BJEO58_01647 [Brevibacterium jeotgali]
MSFQNTRPRPTEGAGYVEVDVWDGGGGPGRGGHEGGVPPRPGVWAVREGVLGPPAPAVQWSCRAVGTCSKKDRRDGSASTRFQGMRDSTEAIAQESEAAE